MVFFRATALPCVGLAFFLTRAAGKGALEGPRGAGLCDSPGPIEGPASAGPYEWH